MAFNPFDAFRKNSKPLMAALTIFVMFVFVLSSGGGGADFFDWIARQLGGNDSRGALMGTIEGNDVRANDLAEIRQRRAAANLFMVRAVSFADQQMIATVDNELKNNAVRDPAHAQELKSGVDLTRTIIEQAEKSSAQTLPFIANFAYQRYEQYSATAATLNDSPNEARLYRYIAKVFYHEWVLIRSSGNMYFGSVGNSTEEEAMQFAIYLRMADSLNIQYVDDDIRRLIRGETEVELTAKDANIIDQQVRRNNFRGLSAEQMFRAIGDEFRVLLLIKIIGGSDFSNRFNVPAAMTPFEFFEFYKDRARELTFDVVDVPVDSFLPKVPAKPADDKELKLLYDKYRAQEYEPSREQPGFRDPRKIKVEYVVFDSTKQEYKKALPFLEAASIVSGGFMPTYVGVGALPGMMAVAGPMIAEPLLAGRDADQIANDLKRQATFAFASHGFGPRPTASLVLDQLADKASGLPLMSIVALRALADANQKLLPSRTLMDRDMPIRDRALYHPLSLAAMIGQLIAPQDPAAAAVSAIIAGRDAAEVIEMRDRIKFGLQMTLAPMSPLFSATPIVALAPALANLPADPAGVYKAQIYGIRQEARPETMAQKDLESLEKALAELRNNLAIDEKKDDPLKKSPPKNDPKKVDLANAEARRLIDNWIKTHPTAKTGKSAALVDKWRIGDDADLSEVFGPLKTKPEREFKQLIESLFFNPGETDTEASNFKPWVMTDYLNMDGAREYVRDYSKPLVVAWKVDDREAKTHDKYDNAPDSVKAEVLKAWRFAKARELAQKAADEFADKVRALAKKELRESDNPAAFDKGLDDLTKEANFPLIRDAAKVAKLQKNVPFHAPKGERQPLRYEGPKITNKAIEFPLASPTEPGEIRPGNAMAELLVEMRNDPVGEVLVVPNQPKNHFYVSVMTKKNDLNVASFYNNIFTMTNVPDARAADRDTLYGTIAFRDIITKFRVDLGERVRSEMRVTETEELKKSGDRQAEPPQ